MIEIELFLIPFKIMEGFAEYLPFQALLFTEVV